VYSTVLFGKLPQNVTCHMGSHSLTLIATRRRQTRPALTPARQAGTRSGTRFLYPAKLTWVVGYIPR